MIDRERVIKKLAVTIQSDSEEWDTVELPIEQAKEILALLKEQIVRCKDCRHWDAKKHECHNIHSYMQYRPCFQDWFCADVEKGET